MLFLSTRIKAPDLNPHVPAHSILVAPPQNNPGGHPQPNRPYPPGLPAEDTTRVARSRHRAIHFLLLWPGSIVSGVGKILKIPPAFPPAAASLRRSANRGLLRREGILAIHCSGYITEPALHVQASCLSRATTMLAGAYPPSKPALVENWTIPPKKEKPSKFQRELPARAANRSAHHLRIESRADGREPELGSAPDFKTRTQTLKPAHKSRMKTRMILQRPLPRPSLPAPL